jgi:hypothetical protein
MAIDGARVQVADEAPEASNLSPQALHGTTVRNSLLLPYPDRLAERAIAKRRQRNCTDHGPVPTDCAKGRRPTRSAITWLVGRPLTDDSGDWARTPRRERSVNRPAIVRYSSAAVVMT